MTFTETLSTGETAEVYGGLVAANAYLAFAVGDAATAWRALANTPDDQKRFLVAATRMLDGLAWQGTANGASSTTLQWPRDNVTDADGNAVDPATVPTGIVNGCFELAAQLAGNASVQDQTDAGSNIQSIGGGGAPTITFFRPTSAQDGNAPVLPLPVLRLVGQYLAAASASAVGASYGTSASDAESAFSDCAAYTVTRA